ncbi:MAG: DsbA family protein [Fimbriimonadaceae bacterium]|nr:DsbA family protein [Fimbriimonadaceae bacterium]
MPLVIPVAHDFTCGWCWVGFFQVLKLRKEFDIEFDWRGYELYPEALELPGPSAPRPIEYPERPKTPSRMALAYAAQDMDPPTNYHPLIRTHNAHEAVEFAKTEGTQNELVERLYYAYWTEATNINDLPTLLRLAEGIVTNIPELESSVKEQRFQESIIGYDEPAYATGVYNIPTFWIGGERYSEQPYRVIANALRKELG